MYSRRHLEAGPVEYIKTSYYIQHSNPVLSPPDFNVWRKSDTSFSSQWKLLGCGVDWVYYWSHVSNLLVDFEKEINYESRLFGITILQAFRYFVNYVSDKIFRKQFVSVESIFSVNNKLSNARSSTSGGLIWSCVSDITMELRPFQLPRYPPF